MRQVVFIFPGHWPIQDAQYSSDPSIKSGRDPSGGGIKEEEEEEEKPCCWDAFFKRFLMLALPLFFHVQVVPARYVLRTVGN